MSARQASGRAEIRLIEASFTDDGYLDTGVSSVLLRQVSNGEAGAAIRLHRTGPILAFGRLDRLRPGYRRAVELARAHGYEPVERLAGGRAAVFHEGTISFSHVVPTAAVPGAYRGTRERFTAMAETMAAALGELAVDARIGEVSGEYCPGEFSVNARGEAKLAGVGQRVLAGGAHVGGVVVVRGAGRIRAVLEPIYEALELDWHPATTGSVALEIGDDDETIPNDRPDPLIERTMAALRTTLSRTYDLIPTTLDETTLALAGNLAPTHQPRVGPGRAR